ncbi:uncharacterized protein LOC127800182 isoform X2 [Diospyros lotus]|uniref:uncharacterized protein LOC127800182 isoform X2 n=1 Tax=Diospyros lotus TaxID=55363 RepID=UPI00224F63F4|nr:uncharacterized protein LOC127800182 isoform X2 [Diospyros lotus]
MHEMEEGATSGGASVKKKSSSGCLIIKKKGDGAGGVGTPGSIKVYQSNKAKKKSRLVVSDSKPSGELSEPFRRKVVSRTDKFRNSCVQDSKCYRDGEIQSDRKRRLDVFEFDEYDAIDGKRMRKGDLQDRFKLKNETGGQAVSNKRKLSYIDSAGNSSGGRKDMPGKNRLDVDDDEADLPISALRQKIHVQSNDSIRLQGKNGVLKVLVNKKKKMDLPQKFYDHQLEVKDRKGSKSEKAVRKNLSVRPSFPSDSKLPKKEKSFVKTEKSEPELQKAVTASAKAGNSENEDKNTSLMLASASTQSPGSSKLNSGRKAPSAEKISPVGKKKGKGNRGRGTEKQLLREKIRNMLVSAGWAIDYRPRRNRDYLDAVYICPMGTAYWSIIKAYDALQKQLEEEDIDIEPSNHPSPLTPLSDELLSKLTRKTRKKIKREMKMKRRDSSRNKNVNGVGMEEFADGTDSEKNDEKLSSSTKQNGKLLTGRSHERANVSGDDSSGTSHERSRKKKREKKLSTATNSRLMVARSRRKIGRCTLLVRSSDNVPNSDSDGYVPYRGKRTLLSWLIDSGTVHLSEKVLYMNRRQTRVMLEGWITRDGIHCGCCSKIITVSKFEIHAGSKLRQPFQNIHLESGISLLQCQIDAWNMQEESDRHGFHTVDIICDDPNDDTCGLCGDGGDLICCDSCPSTFHQNCLDIKMLPPGDWHCPNCTCKFCGVAGGSMHGKCTTVGALPTCNLCEKKYHESCRQDMDALSADSNCSITSFCGRKCQELFDCLHKLVGVKHELEGGFSWYLIHRTDLDMDALLHGFPHRVECNSKLAVALSVMDECFLPIVDRRSGINLIHNVIYNCGSNFRRLNYSGFYTAILERGDEIISAASIRIHGTALAEMPFIGTRPIYRRLGMCRRLFCAIESALWSLRVEKLTIPAIAEHMHTWTTVFGFNPLEESHKQEMRLLNMLVFPGIDMLQKLLVEQNLTDRNITAHTGENSAVIKDNNDLIPVSVKNCDVDSSAQRGLDTCDDAGLQKAEEMSEKPATADSNLPVTATTSNGNSCPNGYFDIPSESKLQPLIEKTTLSLPSIEKLTESSTDLRCSPTSDANSVLEMENPVFSVKGETSTMNTAEKTKGDQNPPLDVLNGTDETSKQIIFDLSHHSAVSMGGELSASSEGASEAKVEPLEGMQSSLNGHKDDPHHVTSEVSCVACALKSSGGISAESTTKINVNQDQVSASSPHGADKCSVPLASDSILLDALGVESKLNVASQASDAEVASDAMVTSVEINVRSSAASGSSDNAETNCIAACVKPVPDCSIDTSGQSHIEEMNDNLNHVSLSSLHGTGQSLRGCNSDLIHQSKFELEGKFPVDSEVSSEAEVGLVKSSIQSSSAGNIGGVHEVNGEVATVGTDFDCFGEGCAQNKEINEDEDPVSVSIYEVPDKSTIQVDSNVNKNDAIEEKSDLLVASEAATDEEIALVGSNIPFKVEDDVGKDAHNVNIINTSFEPVLTSSGETSLENATKDVKENVSVSKFHGSNGHTVHFETDQKHN